MNLQPNRHDAARGLEQHRNALVFRVFVLVVAVVWTVAQIGAKSGGEPGGLAMLLGLAELGATAVAIAGLSRFSASAPGTSGTPATFAITCLVGVVAIDLYVLWVLWRVMDAVAEARRGGMPSLSILDDVERLPTLQMIAGVAGLLAVLFVLGSIAGIGREIGDAPLARRARGMMAAVVALAASYATILHWAQHARASDSSSLLPILGVLVAFALVVLFAYIGLLSNAAAALRGRGDNIPEARVVDS